MFLSRALGAALLAVPLAGASGQSTSRHPPPGAPGGDSSGSHRFAWIASAGVASAAVFTTFVRLSDHRAGDARSGPPVPGTPVPNRYTDGTLPGDGFAPGQDPPPTNDAASQEPGPVLGGDHLPDLTDTPRPPGWFLDLPPETASGTNDDPPGGPNTGAGDPSNDPPLLRGPQTSLALAVTTPEPETLSLLGTGLIPLISLVRRGRSLARRPG